MKVLIALALDGLPGVVLGAHLDEASNGAVGLRILAAMRGIR